MPNLVSVYLPQAFTTKIDVTANSRSVFYSLFVDVGALQNLLQ